jgi:Zn-dependent peptidase ImmA (M78 family)
MVDVLESSGGFSRRLKLRADFRAAEQKAKDVLREFGFDRPPIDPQFLSEQLGVTVFFAEFDEASRGVSGFYDPEDLTIYVNKNDPPVRQTFTIAHELGHHLMHAEWAKSSDYKVLMRNTEVAQDPYEQEANAFAAHLLVPADMLKSYKSLAGVQDLARLFMVSVPVIRNRLDFESRRG